jgi:hypothetical protein
MDDKNALAIFRLKARVSMLEALLLSGQVIFGAIPVPRDANKIRASAKRTQDALESVAALYERDRLADSALHEAERHFTQTNSAR